MGVGSGAILLAGILIAISFYFSLAWLLFGH
jgi:hypothetical protein